MRAKGNFHLHRYSRVSRIVNLRIGLRVCARACVMNICAMNYVRLRDSRVVERVSTHTLTLYGYEQRQKETERNNFIFTLFFFQLCMQMHVTLVLRQANLHTLLHLRRQKLYFEAFVATSKDIFTQFNYICYGTIHTKVSKKPEILSIIIPEMKKAANGLAKGFLLNEYSLPKKFNMIRIS